MRIETCGAAAVCALALGVCDARAATPPNAEPSIERGRYVVMISGCNDCHTAGFAQSGGTVPQSEWLKGDRMGWHGPWGTTFGPNLRIYMRSRSEDEWVQIARTFKARPPMPWWALNAMNETDLRSLYRFARSLGEPGSQVPPFLPPEKKPSPPYMDLVAPPAKQAR